MLRAIEHIEHALAGKDQSALAADPILRAAVERFIEIVSEGSRHLPQEITQSHPEIPWRRVADIGNHLRHTYWMIEEDIVWRVATERLPELRAVLQRLADDPSLQ
jgi:uncharacterized protein with HEPN domain